MQVSEQKCVFGAQSLRMRATRVHAKIKMCVCTQLTSVSLCICTGKGRGVQRGQCSSRCPVQRLLAVHSGVQLTVLSAAAARGAR